jgi:dephospho-CoA kinase
MIRIGLTGSIAMGKSEVARILVEAGLPLFDSDKEVHKLYDSAEGAALLSPYVPDAIRNGRVDRSLLSKIVIADQTKLNQLETLVHGEIANRREAFAAAAENNGHSLVVFDVPLLFEKNLEKTVDVTVVVSAPETEQRKRALSRDGMTPEKLDMILSRQMPDREKRKRADYIIENNGTLADLAERTRAMLMHIKRTHTL